MNTLVVVLSFFHYICPLTPSPTGTPPATDWKRPPGRPRRTLASTGGRRYGSTHQCVSIRNPGPLVVEIATTVSRSRAAVSERVTFLPILWYKMYTFECLKCCSNGDLDPWSVGGVLESPSPSLIAIMIKDAAHHLDLRGSHPDDTAAVVAARQREKAIVKRWLWQYWHRPQHTTEQV